MRNYLITRTDVAEGKVELKSAKGCPKPTMRKEPTAPKRLAFSRISWYCR